jgi:uncharacterized protein YcbK (DUF882 family)
MFRRMPFAAFMLGAIFCLSFSSLTDARSVSGHRGLHPRLVGLLYITARHFRSPVIVISGCRSRAHNRRIGGARQSWHVRCMAADIRVQGVSEHRVVRYARTLPGRGGIGTYCRNSVVHIDVGPRREWHQRCGRKKFKRKRRR